MTYIRFVTEQLDPDSGRHQGLFQAAFALRQRGAFSETEEAHLKEIREWFNEHLEKPTAFSRAKRPHAVNRAISWFKDTATEHIKRMYEFAAVLEMHDVTVKVVKTPRPGYVVYEDDFQVVAEPYATETIT